VSPGRRLLRPPRRLHQQPEELTAKHIARDERAIPSEIERGPLGVRAPALDPDPLLGYLAQWGHSRPLRSRRPGDGAGAFGETPPARGALDHRVVLAQVLAPIDHLRQVMGDANISVRSPPEVSRTCSTRLELTVPAAVGQCCARRAPRIVRAPIR